MQKEAPWCCFYTVWLGLLHEGFWWYLGIKNSWVAVEDCVGHRKTNLMHSDLYQFLELIFRMKYFRTLSWFCLKRSSCSGKEPWRNCDSRSWQLMGCLCAVWIQSMLRLAVSQVTMLLVSKEVQPYSCLCIDQKIWVWS